jgi:hypothetical protein
MLFGQVIIRSPISASGTTVTDPSFIKLSNVAMAIESSISWKIRYISVTQSFKDLHYFDIMTAIDAPLCCPSDNPQRDRIMINHR